MPAAAGCARKKISSATSSARRKRARCGLRIAGEKLVPIGIWIAAAEALGLVAQHRRVDVGGADRVHAHAARRELERERARQVADAALRRAVDRGARVALQAGIGRQVHDRAARLDEMGDRRGAQEEQSLQVHAHDPVEVCLERRLGGTLRPEAGGVHEAVEPARRCQGRLDRRLAIRDATQIGRGRRHDGFPERLLYARKPLGVAIGRDHAPAAGREALRRCAADPTRRAAHQHDRVSHAGSSRPRSCVRRPPRSAGPSRRKPRMRPGTPPRPLPRRASRSGRAASRVRRRAPGR